MFGERRRRRRDLASPRVAARALSHAFSPSGRGDIMPSSIALLTLLPPLPFLPPLPASAPSSFSRAAGSRATMARRAATHELRSVVVMACSGPRYLSATSTPVR